MSDFEVKHKGNLPSHMQKLAVERCGNRTARFFEYPNMSIMEKKIHELKLEEASITLDRKSEKGFMVAFQFKQESMSELIALPGGNKLMVMNLHYCVLSDSDMIKYGKILDQARQKQESDMHDRREINEINRKNRKKKKNKNVK